MLFNILPGSTPEYTQHLEVDSGFAMVTSGGFSWSNYRPEFDVSVPVFSPLAADVHWQGDAKAKTWLVVSAQSNMAEEFRPLLTDIAGEQPRFLLLDRCQGDVLNIRTRCREDQVFAYPQILQVRSQLFFLLPLNLNLSQM